MSFMFNPHPYDDPEAVNTIELDQNLHESIISGTGESAKKLAEEINTALASGKRNYIIALDGYVSAPIEQFMGALSLQCAQTNLSVQSLSTTNLFLDSDKLDEKLLPYLPEDETTDPVLLFGSLYHEGYEGLMNAEKIAEFTKKIKEFKKFGTGILIIHGNAALIDAFQNLYDLKLFIDMTQKHTILNIKNGLYKNLGDNKHRPFKEIIRRSYYVDFEAAAALRGQLIRNDKIDYYMTGDKLKEMQLVPLRTLKAIFETMISYPLRCKPVYNEGVWGGQYIKKMRKLPEKMKNCAWSFDLIPMEVSIVADLENIQLDFPFYCFVQTMAPKLMGEKPAEKFGGYFPIRFNYDDTFHSSGNMSIQVHPDEEYITKNNNELGRQDESYYIVVSGQQAKTYCGFKNEADVEEFLDKAKRAEQYGEKMNHDDYVHSIDSEPGMQFMIPAGTIHASGRNQVILEIGSLTIGSYTYKLYDYMRKDLDGNLRPIHLHHGEKVLRQDYTEDWVSSNLIQEPRVVCENSEFKETIVGEHDLLYFSLRNVVFDDRYTDETTDRFHVLVLVEGEKCLIRSLTNPNRYFEQKYLDMVIVPADFGPYEVINQEVGTVTIHKTLLKDGYEND